MSSEENWNFAYGASAKAFMQGEVLYATLELTGQDLGEMNHQELLTQLQGEEAISTDSTMGQKVCRLCNAARERILSELLQSMAPHLKELALYNRILDEAHQL
jgi:hypothetical protein